MATVHGPIIPHHPSPFRTSINLLRPSMQQPPTKVNPSQVSSSAASKSASPSDPFYGHEEIARLCSRFVTHLFACPDYPMASTSSSQSSSSTPGSSPCPPQTPCPPLANFIAYALHRTRLHPSVTFASLYLLQRLKARFPAARGSSGHRLFISAFMLASKVICDDTYSNKSWCIVGQGLFALREINQMEREMCGYLEWELGVDRETLDKFEKDLRSDFDRDRRGYPTYEVSPPKGSFGEREREREKEKARMGAEVDVNAPPLPPYPPIHNRHKSASSSSSTTTPSPSKSKPKTTRIPGGTANNPLPPPPVPIPNPFAQQQPQHTHSAQPNDDIAMHSTPPLTPDTPSSSYSDTSSPAMSLSPPTPPDGADIIVGYRQKLVDEVMVDKDLKMRSMGHVEAVKPIPMTTNPSIHIAGTGKTGREPFAFALPAVW